MIKESNKLMLKKIYKLNKILNPLRILDDSDLENLKEILIKLSK